MTPELWQRLKPLYEAALELEGAERAQFLAQARRQDSELGEELQKLVEVEGLSSPLDRPIFDFYNLLEEPAPALAEGEIVNHRFKIVRLLGSGGMGDVYEARDLDLKMGRIALKTIRPAIARNPSLLRRFKEEVILARRVTGTHVCRIHEFFDPPAKSSKGSNAFLTMEYLEGTTLSKRIEESGPFSLPAIKAIAFQLCEALQSIHDAGVIHRDLKPRNIMLAPSSEIEKVVVMDFGLAHAVSGEASAEVETQNTLPGTIMGTPEYMAPEQFVGGTVSPATDIYALGLILYELITGKQLYAANTSLAAAMRRGRRAEIPSSVLRGVPSVWGDVIATCLEFDSERRYQSVAEVVSALKQKRLVLWRFRDGRGVALSRRKVVVIAAGLLFFASALGWYLFRDAYSYHMRPEVREWYERGADNLRDGAYFDATKAFKMAVQLDDKYPLTHARLAEAWNELDFTEQARDQMVRASDPEQQASLTKVERKYVDAVRATLIGDFDTAVRDYEAVLSGLPTNRKDEGIVDLGRAYEKAGRMTEAMGSYEKVATPRSNSPTPFLHLGILRSRSGDTSAAEAAFDQAEKLYRAKSNEEGIAEVNYQRGYAANDRGDFQEARRLLSKLPNLADPDANVRLTVRTLSQLSSVEYNSTTTADKSNDARALAYADQEGQLAEENGLEYWVTDSLMRKANALLDEEKYPEAERYLQKALDAARKNKHPHLEAFLNLTLSSVYDHMGRRPEQISHARDALKYFAIFAFTSNASDASTLIIRGEEQLGNLKEALLSAKELLRIAKKSNNPLTLELGEQTLGGILSSLEQYPAALVEFQSALEKAHVLHSNEAYDALGCADVLWRLGRYSEATKMLDSIPQESKIRDDVGSGILETESQIQLSQGQNREASATALGAIQKYPDEQPEKIATLSAVAASAEARLGHLAEAMQLADNIASVARKQHSGVLMATAQLAYAEIALRDHMPLRAMKMAETANGYFTEKELPESRWLAFTRMAQAARDSGDIKLAVSQAKEALDILNTLEQTWGSDTFKVYILRPDYQLARRELNAILH